MSKVPKQEAKWVRSPCQLGTKTDTTTFPDAFTSVKDVFFGEITKNMTSLEFQKKLLLEPKMNRSQKIICTRPAALVHIEPLLIDAAWLVEVQTELPLHPQNIYSYAVDYYVANSPDHLPFVDRDTGISPGVKRAFIDAVKALAGLSVKSYQSEVDYYTTLLHPVKNSITKVVHSTLEILYNVPSAGDDSSEEMYQPEKPDCQVVADMYRREIRVFADEVAVEVFTDARTDEFSTRPWHLHNGWEKMVREVGRSCHFWNPDRRGKHIIRSLTWIDQNTKDIRISYWKVLRVLDPSSGEVIGLELCCVYDERLYLNQQVRDSAEHMRPAKILMNICTLLNIHFEIGLYGYELSTNEASLLQPMKEQSVSFFSLEAPPAVSRDEAGEVTQEECIILKQLIGTLRTVHKIKIPEEAILFRSHRNWKTWVIPRVRLVDYPDYFMIVVAKVFAEGKKAVEAYRSEIELCDLLSRLAERTSVHAAVSIADSRRVGSNFAICSEHGVTLSYPLSYDADNAMPFFYKSPLRFTMDVLKILLVFQHQGVIHGDLKPANLVLSLSKQQVLAIDFSGSALGGFTSFDSNNWLVPQVPLEKIRSTTEHYAAPEFKEGAALVDSRIDVYSAGIALAEMMNIFCYACHTETDPILRMVRTEMRVTPRKTASELWLLFQQMLLTRDPEAAEMMQKTWDTLTQDPLKPTILASPITVMPNTTTESLPWEGRCPKLNAVMKLGPIGCVKYHFNSKGRRTTTLCMEKYSIRFPKRFRRYRGVLLRAIKAIVKKPFDAEQEEFRGLKPGFTRWPANERPPEDQCFSLVHSVLVGQKLRLRTTDLHIPNREQYNIVVEAIEEQLQRIRTQFDDN